MSDTYYTPEGLTEEAYKSADVWKEFNIVEYDVAISDIAVDGKKSAGSTIYNLSGARVSSPRKGEIMIVRGKKMLVK